MLYANSSITFGLSTIMKDEDSDSLIYAISQNPFDGMLTLEGTKIIYTPNENFIGLDEIMFVVSDGTSTVQGLVHFTIVSP